MKNSKNTVGSNIFLIDFTQFKLGRFKKYQSAGTH